MRLKQVIEELGLCPLHLLNEDEAEVTEAYCGDLLSDVLAHTKPNTIWFTIQGHVNVVAVAQLRDIVCVVLVNGVAPDPQTMAKARTQGVNLCGSELTSAELCMKLAGKL
jgi:hypothetical protein